MALHRLGQTETSRATLNRLREVMKDATAMPSEEDTAFLREAERLILGPPDALREDVFAP